MAENACSFRATLAKLQPEQEEKIQRVEISKKLAPESLPKGVTVTALEVIPKEIKLGKMTDYAQLLISARLSDGRSTVMVAMCPRLYPLVTAASFSCCGPSAPASRTSSS